MSGAFLLEEWNYVFLSLNINEVWYKWKDEFFATVESFIPCEDNINRTSRLVMAASHHHGSVTTSVDLCVQKIDCLNELNLPANLITGGFIA